MNTDQPGTIAIGPIAILVAFAAAILHAPVLVDAAPKPNIVYILADDLGWNDVSYHGSNIRTPNIDRIAKEGLELDRFYVCPICSPTRSGLMTGRWPQRFGLMRSVVPPWRDFGLDPEETTIAEMLAGAEYEQRTVVGKWHLGHSSRKYHPLNQGFTGFYGHYNGALDYFTHQREGELDWHRGFDSSYDKGYSTDLLADEAVRVIDNADAAAPFFLYVPFNAPHSPFQATEEDLAANDHIKRPQRKMLAAMVTGLDRGIGRILDALDRKGIADNTIVWFSSDNGGVEEPRSSNQPLRGKKGDVFEGGVRVTAAVRWPQGFQGGRKIDAVTGYIDVYPTLMAVAGVEQSPGKPLDGRNMLPVFRGEAEGEPRTWYHYIAQRGNSEKLAVMEGDWKLVLLDDRIDLAEQRDRIPRMLFNLQKDPYEKQDLAAEHPDRVARMWKMAGEFRKLEPADALPAYNEGKEGFQPPKEWKIPE
jgi:arylsulfatase B